MCPHSYRPAIFLHILQVHVLSVDLHKAFPSSTNVFSRGRPCIPNIPLFVFTHSSLIILKYRLASSLKWQWDLMRFSSSLYVFHLVGQFSLGQYLGESRRSCGKWGRDHLLYAIHSPLFLWKCHCPHCVYMFYYRHCRRLRFRRYFSAVRMQLRKTGSHPIWFRECHLRLHMSEYFECSLLLVFFVLSVIVNIYLNLGS